MEDSENGGEGDMQARNRTVVNLPREKIEKRYFEWMVFRQFSSFSIQVESLRF